MLYYLYLQSSRGKMMKSTKEVEQALRNELAAMSMKQLRKTAAEIGVTRAAYKSREELIEQAITLELYAFTH